MPFFPQEGRTALILAAAAGCAEGVRALLAAGADRSVESKDGRTAFDAAVKNKMFDSAWLTRTDTQAKDVIESIVLVRPRGCLSLRPAPL